MLQPPPLPLQPASKPGQSEQFDPFSARLLLPQQASLAITV